MFIEVFKDVLVFGVVEVGELESFDVEFDDFGVGLYFNVSGGIGCWCEGV